MFAHLIPGPDFIGRAVQELRLRRDISVLAALDDRVPADIGLSRGGVESAIRSGRAPQRFAGK
jgi:uncharacterized protein YjiS (DUF1127 family)